MNPAESTAEDQLLNALPDLLAPFGTARSNLIPILQTVQKRFFYLPPAALDIVARHLGIPLAEVYGALARALAMPPAEIVAAVEASGLRGRGRGSPPGASGAWPPGRPPGAR